MKGSHSVHFYKGLSYVLVRQTADQYYAIVYDIEGERLAQTAVVVGAAAARKDACNIIDKQEVYRD